MLGTWCMTANCKYSYIYAIPLNQMILYTAYDMKDSENKHEVFVIIQQLHSIPTQNNNVILSSRPNHGISIIIITNLLTLSDWAIARYYSVNLLVEILCKNVEHKDDNDSDDYSFH
jgi:hypothetical protein